MLHLTNFSSGNCELRLLAAQVSFATVAMGLAGVLLALAFITVQSGAATAEEGHPFSKLQRERKQTSGGAGAGDKQPPAFNCKVRVDESDATRIELLECDQELPASIKDPNAGCGCKGRVHSLLPLLSSSLLPHPPKRKQKENKNKTAYPVCVC